MTSIKLSQQRALTERVSHSIDISVCEIGDCLKGGTSLASLRSARSVPGFVVQIFVFCRCVSKGGTSLASLRSARSVPGYVVQFFDSMKASSMRSIADAHWPAFVGDFLNPFRKSPDVYGPCMVYNVSV